MWLIGATIQKKPHAESARPFPWRQDYAKTCIKQHAAVISCPDPPISVVLDVLHHQHAEGRIWQLLHGFRVHLECNQTFSHMNGMQFHQ